MALWGNQDNLTGPTPVTIVGTATSEFWTMAGADFVAAGIETGMTAILEADGVEGFATIEAFITPTLAKVGQDVCCCCWSIRCNLLRSANLSKE